VVTAETDKFRIAHFCVLFARVLLSYSVYVIPTSFRSHVTMEGICTQSFVNAVMNLDLSSSRRSEFVRISGYFCYTYFRVFKLKYEKFFKFSRPFLVKQLALLTYFRLRKFDD